MLNKTGYGEKAKIEEAKAAGKINEGDFVVTDTDEFAFINPKDFLNQNLLKNTH